MRAAVLFLVAGLVAAPVFAQEVWSPASAPNEIRTTASSTRSIAPELAVIRFEFSARDTTPIAAARAAGAIEDAVRKAVAKAGVPEDSILGRGSLSFPGDQTIQMETKPNPEFKRYDTTYVFRDLMEVRVRDLKRVSRVIDAALLGGAQKLVFLQFSSSRTQQLGQEALEEATRQARRNAEIMAQAAGGKLGRPLELTTERAESGNAFYDLRSSHATQMTLGAMAAPPGAELRVSVYGRWELLAQGDSRSGR
jgi:uncharacterized protein YggE